jgi:PAS domain S-box-containing protein
MNLQEKQYLNKITASIALLLNEENTITGINDFGLKKWGLTDQQIEAKSLGKLKADITTSINEFEAMKSEHWEKFFNAIPMPVFIKDRQHRWSFFNEALCKLQNRTRIELQDKNDYDFFPKSQADKFWKEEESVFQTGKEIYSEEPSSRNGIDSYVLIKKTIVKTSDGKEYLIGCCIDITKRKKAELALLESERRFRSLIRHSPDIISIIGKDQTIKFMSPSFYRLTGYTENEILNTIIVDILHQNDKEIYLEIIENIISSPLKVTQSDLRLRKKNGEYVILEVYIKDLSFDPAIDGIVVNCSDVTTIRNQSAEIVRINKLLENDNNSLKGQLKNEIEAKIDLKPLAFVEFKKIYPDNSTCLNHLSELKWRNGFRCKKCNNLKFCDGKFNFSRRCTKCGYEETATTNTIFYRVKFPILEAFYMYFLISSHHNLTAKKLAQLTLINENTCSSFKRKINGRMMKENSKSGNWENKMLMDLKK